MPSYTKTTKPSASYSKSAAYSDTLLTFQDGDIHLFQEGSEFIIQSLQDPIYSLTTQPSAIYTRTPKP